MLQQRRSLLGSVQVLCVCPRFPERDATSLFPVQRRSLPVNDLLCYQNMANVLNEATRSIRTYETSD